MGGFGGIGRQAGGGGGLDLSAEFTNVLGSRSLNTWYSVGSNTEVALVAHNGGGGRVNLQFRIRSPLGAVEQYNVIDANTATDFGISIGGKVPQGWDYQVWTGDGNTGSIVWWRERSL